MIVVVIAVIAGVVATVVQRRARPATPVPTGHHVPETVERADFPRPDAPWLVAVFTSATCNTCAGLWEKARHLESPAVSVVELEVSEAKAVHDRYGIDGVPTTVIADEDGAVRRSFLGPVTATDLWAAVAELREPGSVPEACHDHT